MTRKAFADEIAGMPRELVLVVILIVVVKS